jgi:hypothetical protein
MLLITPNRIVVVDDDPALIDRLEDLGVDAIRGDISDPTVLERAGSTRRQGGHLHRATHRGRRSRPSGWLDGRTGRARARPHLRPRGGRAVRALGGHPVLYSEAAAEEFVDWLDEGAAPDLDEDPI